eukprot:TRINITY_DN33011_c0_g1_i1.p1 TRINITY_DN33011_c0_g1~~TRINITY_DN33011_c0_g1_i1.p1  ORF type:complete len:202 (+),score=27.38 TRINITY_DN33011_c0_g1_i1:52-606(+)
MTAIMMDELLRCPICYDYFQTAMIFPSCSHNYCSVCIRRSLSFKTECPTCRAPSDSTDLRPNRIIDSLVLAYSSTTPTSSSSIKPTSSSSSYHHVENSGIDDVSSPLLKRKMTETSLSPTSTVSLPSSKSRKKESSSSSTMTSSSTLKGGTKKSSFKPPLDISHNSNITVECPICQLMNPIHCM